jgi:aminoglycoside N3'-acetyltransferase
MMKGVLRSVLPQPVLALVRAERARLKQFRERPRYALSEDHFRAILTEALHVRAGDVVFVHSSVDRLGLAFPFYRILPLLRTIVGERGTVLFPTYPRLAAHEALLSGEVFDIRKSPSYTGILTEFARQQPGAVRSLNPTKSVCALGPDAGNLTATHHKSPFPYDWSSPYGRLIEFEAKIIGLGVSTRNLSFVHCVDDELKDDFPVRPYFPRLFEGRCLTADGRAEVVPTFAHDPAKMQRDVARFLRLRVSEQAPDVYRDMEIHRMPFFWANARPLFEIMVALARQGITMYERTVYEPPR